jgi:recombination protein RecR
VYPPPLRSLIDELGRLPGIGPKSAQRLAFYLLRQPDAEARRLAAALVEMREETALCEVCCNVADRSGRCQTCADPRRDATMICVVEDPRDVAAVERSGAFHGTYHVLHGALSPLEGVGPDQLHIAELKARLAEGGVVVEVILCTNPNVEGDATATYLSRELSGFGVAITRPASGLPVGGDLEFADDATLGRALAGRRPVEG